MNMKFNDTDKTTPFICGTVVRGGWQRKLRMLRADMFSLLTISKSAGYVTSKRQTRAITRGILGFVNDTQKIIIDDVITALYGWERVLQDMCFKNDVFNIKIVNEPENLKTWIDPDG